MQAVETPFRLPLIWGAEHPHAILTIGDYIVIRHPGEKFESFRERIRKEARLIKDRLKGRIIKEAGGRKIRGRRKGHRTGLIFDDAVGKRSYLRQSRAKRKTRKKMAYKSKRINRLRKA